MYLKSDYYFINLEHKEQTNLNETNNINKSNKNDEIQVKSTPANPTTTNSIETRKEESLSLSSSEMLKINDISNSNSIKNKSSKQQLLEKPDNAVDSTSLSSSSSSSSTSSSSSVTISGVDNLPSSTTTTNDSTTTSDVVSKQSAVPLIENLSLGSGETQSSSNINLNNLNALQQQLAVAAAALQQQQNNSSNTEGFNPRAAAAVVLAAQMSKSGNLNGNSSPLAHASLQQQKPMVQGWNQQTPWQQQQQLMSPLNTNTAEAKAAAAVWTNALNAAANSNIQQQQLQLIKLSANKNAQFNTKTPVSATNNSGGVPANKIVNTSANTITQALNSMYSPSQIQKVNSNGAGGIKLAQGTNGKHLFKRPHVSFLC